MKLSDKIVGLRKSNGMSQEDLAEKLDVSRQAISRWESGAAMPDANNILQLSKLFDVTTDYLLNDDYQSDNDKGYNPEMQKAHDYVVHWSEMKAKSIGLLLWGDVGTGKSFFAGCIANALLEQGVPVLMTNFSRILNALSGLYSEEKNQYIDSLNQYSLLIIDDLGIERSTEFALEQVFNVIDSRYRSKLPLIVTTNMTLEELKNPQDLTRSRIYDRVLERCVPLRINNQNIRQRNAAESMKEARKILESGTGT